MKHMVDLCSGFGGASEDFINDPNWNILRIDNNPLLANVPNTVIMDLATLEKYKLNLSTNEIDLVWVSPPCREHSTAFLAPKSIASRAGIDYEPDFSVLESALSIIEQLQPRYWVIENVHGAIKDFEPYLGKPRQIIGPYVLWGNFPYLTPQDEIKSKKSKDVHSSNPLRSNYKAIVDLSISKALKEAVMNQKSITEY